MHQPPPFFFFPQAGAAAIPGTLHVVNSLDRFKAFDWGGALGATAAAIWAAASDGRSDDQASSPPLPLASALSHFILVVHADLKTHQYTYWAAFPAVKPPAAVVGAPPRSLDEALGASAAAAVAAAATRLLRPQGGDDASPASPPPPAFCVTLGDDGTAATSPLADVFCAPPPATRRILAFWDTAAALSAPGWPLRNLVLAATARMPPGGTRRVLTAALRARRGVVDPTASLGLDASLPTLPPDWPPPPSPPPAVGWEAGPRGGRPGPRRAGVGAALDARRVATRAVALNLRLMRWRAATDLDPGIVSRASFLLIGAGTLGCAAARCLVGWGVTKITFVDAGTVSHSNPARQSLYTAADAVVRAPKAETAAAALARVTPGADAARGISLEVPMPGHPPATPAEETTIRTAIATLATEVAAADVVMLLTDTRESRWLPTLLAAAAAADPGDAGKPPPLAITAAIGFDTYVVMRHGVPQQEEEDKSGGGGTSGDRATHITPPTRLGCYFCADVVAPTDSTRDRALDQQCTVSRPGLAPLAASLAVEVAAAALVHPRGAAAPPPGVNPAEDAAAPLGPVPHQLRGRLGGGFASGALVGGAARQCVACSRAAVAAWRARGADYVLAAARDPACLERETGLDALHAAAEEMVAAAESGGGGDDDDGDEWLEL